MRIAALLICAGTLPSAFCQDVTKAMATPTLPFYQWGACPYEKCAYVEWTLHQPASVYNTWKEDRQPIAQLAVGEKAIGIMGVVITRKPGLIRMDRDLPDRDLRREDTILTYGVPSEGFSAVWFKGKYHSEYDISFAKLPDGTGCGGVHCAATVVDLGAKSWWARVRLNSGRTGWLEVATQGSLAVAY